MGSARTGLFLASPLLWSYIFVHPFQNLYTRSSCPHFIMVIGAYLRLASDIPISIIILLSFMTIATPMMIPTMTISMIKMLHLCPHQAITAIFMHIRR